MLNLLYSILFTLPPPQSKQTIRADQGNRPSKTSLQEYISTLRYISTLMYVLGLSLFKIYILFVYILKINKYYLYLYNFNYLVKVNLLNH